MIRLLKNGLLKSSILVAVAAAVVWTEQSSGAGLETGPAVQQSGTKQQKIVAASQQIAIAKSTEAKSTDVRSSVAKSSDVSSASPPGPASKSAAAASKPSVSDTLRRVDQRFAVDSAEVPDFRRHIEPLFVRLGCNGRACHGSFQGRGGFHLSLFGYDAEADHKELLGSTDDKVDLKHPTESLILQKPTLTIDHEGGLRMKRGGWEYRMLLAWIEGGAKLSNSASSIAAGSTAASTAAASITAADSKPLDVARLEVTPAEIRFQRQGETVQLRAIVHWTDGTSEDVTPICRYQSNDDSLAKADGSGLVTCLGKGDTQVVAFYDNGITPVPVFLPLSNLAGDNYPRTPTANRIDELVLKKLRKLGITESPLSDDAEFLRRASLDVTGALPSPDEVRAFVKDRSPDKRKRKIDELLERPGYAAWWATRLCDLTGNSPLLITWFDSFLASQQWYEWMYDRLRRNLPYDKLVAELVMATSRLPNESYADYCRRIATYNNPDKPASVAEMPTMPFYWSRRNFNKPDEIALGFCYTFLGVQMQCCQCHKHPFDRWTKTDFDDFSRFFSRVGFGVAPADRQEQQAMREAIRKQIEGSYVEKDDEPSPVDDRIARKTVAAARATFLGASVSAIDRHTAPIAKSVGTQQGKAEKAEAATAASAVKLADLRAGKVAPADFKADATRARAKRAYAANLFLVNSRITEMGRQGKPIPQLELYVIPPNRQQNKMLADKGSTNKQDSTNKQAANKATIVAVSSKSGIAKKKSLSTKSASSTSAPSGETAKFLGGETVDLNQYDDPRQAVLDWMHKNPTRYFARVIVNRVWANYFNVGIIQPTDDLNQAHPPSNPELLDYLTTAFVEHGYDLKWLHREILNSRTYQLSWLPNNTNGLDERNFSHAVPRRLPAEIAFDAIRMATANSAERKAAAEQGIERAIGLDMIDGSKKGRPAINRYALRVFGKPARLTNCDCERSNSPSLLQTFFLQNDNETLALIDRDDGWLAEVSKKYGKAMLAPLAAGDAEQPAAKPSIAAKPSAAAKPAPAANLSPSDVDSLIQEAFLRTLSRFPAPAEVNRGRQALAAADSPRAGLRDLLWALINTKEFILNH